MSMFYEEWRLLESVNSSVGTDKFTEINSESSERTESLTANLAVQTAKMNKDDEIHQLELINLPNFPVVAFRRYYPESLLCTACLGSVSFVCGQHHGATASVPSTG